MKKIYFLSFFLFSAAFLNSQTSVTFKICGGNGTDAYLASGSPTSNFGNHPQFGGNTWTCSGPTCNARGLMSFNLSSIPTTATITAANLLLYADNTWGPNPTLGPGNDGSILNVTSAWNESTVTWNTQPSTSTTNSVYIPASSSNVQNYNISMTAMVQNWVTNPSSNNGFLLKMNNEVNTYKSLIFGSSDNSDSTKCPRLQVTYVTSVTATFTTNVGACGNTGTDAYLASAQATSNFGNHPNFGGNTWTCSGPTCNARGLMSFNLSSIPTNAIVTSANLYLFADTGWGTTPTLGPGNDGSILKVTAPWNEGTVTWNTQPATVPTNSVYIPASSSSVQNYIINITPLVQDWVTTPSGNHGYLLKMNNEINTYKSLIFGSSDNSNPALCPYVNITYAIPAGIAPITNNSIGFISVYPNPGNGDYKVKGAAGLDYSIMNISGQMIKKGAFSEDIETLSLNEFNDGIYFVVFRNENSVMTKKLVKIKD